MEIERKYLIEKRNLPQALEQYQCLFIEQAYLCTDPVVRIRQENDSYYLTYKGKGLMVREEYNLPLTAKAYQHLISKADDNKITKKRYRIPLPETDLTIELDVFLGCLSGLILAEVEFPDESTANTFTPPTWFGREVTYSGLYHNSHLCTLSAPPLSPL